MAVKIVHTWRVQEVRFADRCAAERYASRFGGLRAWRVVPVSRTAVWGAGGTVDR